MCPSETRPSPFFSRTHCRVTRSERIHASFYTTLDSEILHPPLPRSRPTPQSSIPQITAGGGSIGHGLGASRSEPGREGCHWGCRACLAIRSKARIPFGDDGCAEWPSVMGRPRALIDLQGRDLREVLAPSDARGEQRPGLPREARGPRSSSSGSREGTWGKA